jgi:hypothetical protein
LRSSTVFADFKGILEVVLFEKNTATVKKIKGDLNVFSVYPGYGIPVSDKANYVNMLLCYVNYYLIV